MLGELSKDRRRLAIKSSGETVFVWTISGIVLAACGGGGGGGGGLSFGPRPAPPVNVSDGPVSGARVYFDIDGDGEVSTAEMVAQGDGYRTGADGRTGGLPSAYRGAAFVAIVDGAIDTDTGKTLSGSYQSIASPDGQHRIATPITDLIARAQREDETTEDVVARILTAARMNPATANQQLEYILDPAYYDAGTDEHGEDLFIISLTNEVAKDKASGRPETDPIDLVIDAVKDGYLTPARISYANTDGMFAENFDTSNHLATLTHPIITITTAVIVGVVYTDKTTEREVTRTGASANDRAEIDRLFSIDLNGGSPQINFVGTGGLDFERADEYTLTVDLGDARDETIPALVKIIVIDVNEPTATIRVSFTEPTTSALMADENDAGWNLQLVAISDAGGGDTSPIAKYEFFDGSSTSLASGIFRIDENGRITITRAFDYETDATSYRLTVRATDSRTPAEHGDIPFTVTVLDANDIVPDLSATTTTATIAENVVGADAGDIRFTIDDDDTNNVFNSDSFTISAGTGTSPTTADKFEIVRNGANWDLKLRARDDANNPLSLDYETDGASGTIRLNVKVNDGVADSNVVPITITLIDANEPPRFAQPRYDVDLPENTATDGSYTIETPTATDRDGDTLIYSIKSGNDAGLFEINSASGAVRLVSAVDFEVAPNTYTLIIEARDRLANDASGLTDTTELVITVTNADDGSGVYELVSSNGFAKRSLLTVMETMPDPDGVSGSIRVEWYKTPKDGTRPTNPFQTTGLMGNYKLTADDVAVGNEVTISAVVKYRDRSGKDEVIDNADLSIKTGNTVIRVEYAGGNTIPETTGFYALDLNENVDGAVLEITAMDPEVEASSTHSVLEVSLDQFATNLGFTLAHSGNNDNIYILSGPSHGLNYETRAANFIISLGEIRIPFTITASFDDPTDNSVRQIDIRINPQDVDEYDIEFTDDATQTDLDYAPSITIDHTGMVTKVEATDEDAAAALSYSITGNSFVIDATSGVITVAAGVTLTARTYALTVTATDATSGDTKTQSVEITVTGGSDTVPPDDDDNDDAPSDDLADAEIYENHPLSKAIGSITVPDGANFMLSDGFDNDLFTIRDGKLWWISTPDYESPADADRDNVYEIEVTFTKTDDTTTRQRYDLEVMDIGPGRYDYGSSNRDGGSRTYLQHRSDVPLPEEPGGLSNYILHGHAFVTPETGPLILTWAHDPDSDFTAAQVRPITERAFAAYEAVANFKFIEVDWSASKDIEMLFEQRQGSSVIGEAHSRHGNNQQMDRIRLSSQTIEVLETDRFYVVIHEIGHILGLKHPFEEIGEGGWSWDRGHFHNPNTIMSYYLFENDPDRGDELLPADIAALRFLYGPPEGTAGAEDWEPPHWLVRNWRFHVNPSPSSEPIFISETAAAGTELYTITAENNFLLREPNLPTPARSEYELRNEGDNEFFQFDSVTGVLSLKQKLDYSNPLDQGNAYLYTGNNVYEVAIRGSHFFDDAATQARWGNQTFIQYVTIVVFESIDLATEVLTDINLVTRGAAKTPTDYGGKEVIGTDGVNRISDGHGHDIIRGNGNDDIITLTTTPKDENKVIYRIGNQVALDGGDQVTGFERGKDELILALPENTTTSAITNFAGFVSHINGGTPTDLTDDWFGVKLVTDAGKTMVLGLSFHFEKIVVGAGSSPVMDITFSTSVPLSDALGSTTLASITNSDGFLTDFGLLDDLLGGEQSFKFITEEFTITTNTTYAPTLSVAYTTGTAGTIDESVDAGTAVTGITFTAGDVDGGSLTYHIIGGDGMHIFEILEANRTTGKITLKANATLDDETKPNYTLSVVVRDSDGAASIPVEVNINVTEEPRTHPLKVRATNDAPNQITDFDRGKDKLTFMLEATDISESGSSLKNGDSISEFIKYVTNDSIGWKDDPLSIVLDYRFPHGQVELHGLSFYSRVGVDDGDSVLVGNLTFSEAISNHQEIINFHGDRQKILNTTNGNAILVDLDYLDDLLGGVDSFGFEIV